MIQVPRRQQGVAPTAPLPGVRISPEAPGSAFQPPAPIDLTGATRGLAELVQKERDKADNIAILDADNQLAQLQTDLETKATSVRGKDALNAMSDAKDEWQQGADKIRSGLTNERQQLLFDNRASGRYDNLYSTIAHHTQQEVKAYEDLTTKTALDQRLSDAINHYTDPAQLRQALGETRAIIAVYGRQNGWGADVVQTKTAEQVSRVQVGVIDRMLDNKQDLAAKTYYGQVKDQVTGADAGPLEERLKVGSVRGESQRQADKILAGTDGLSEAVAKARAIEDPDVRDAVEQRVRSDFAERAQALTAQREQLMTAASNIIDKTGDVNSIPTSIWASMTIAEKGQARGYAKTRNEPAAVKTDLGTWYKLEQQATTPETRDEFAQIDLNQYRTKLSPSDFQEMAKLQGGVRKGDAATEAKLQGLQTKRQIVTGVLHSIGIGVDPRKRKPDAELANQFRTAVDEQVEQQQEATGKPVSSADVRKIANELATRHTVERAGRFWGTNRDDVRTFEMMPEEKIIMSISDVPANYRSQISAALRQRGKPASDDAVVDVYRRYIQQLAPAP